MSSNPSTSLSSSVAFGRTMALPSLPETSRLNAALRETVIPVYDDEGGYRERRNWTLPAKITPDLRADARRQIVALEAMLRPAAREDVRAFLVSLGLLVVSAKRTVDDAATRVNAYVGMLEVPSGILTRDTLNRAASAFQWWPSYAELSRFFDDESERLRLRRKRLQAIIDGKDRETADENTWTGPRTLSQAVQDAIAKLRADAGMTAAPRPHAAEGR